MKKTMTACVMSLVLIFGAAAAQAGPYEKITIATEGAFAPWNFTGSDGKLAGFEVELAQDLCKRMGVEYTLVPQAWDGIIPSLTSGKYDAIMAAMSITEKRQKVVDFSRYYAATPSVFIVSGDSGSTGLKIGVTAITLDEMSPEEDAAMKALAKEFKGKTIGVQAATIQERFLTQYLGEAVDIRSYDTQENLELDLSSGRIDAALGAMSYWVPRLKTDHGKDFKMVGPGMTKGPFGKGVGVAVRKTDPELGAMFSKAINEAIADGTISRLAIKWFTFDASAKE
ncbi:MAG: transporter substrate-binding domain-containing protein [Desulfobacterales bacterium]|nr:transporter substrate-binding domain-containing protein [Desulfobacterales bacterium]